MIEANACGTPVIAHDAGSVPEVITNGENGIIVTRIEEAIDAVSKIRQMSRSRCRQIFEERFTSTRMAQDYVKIYNSIIERNVRYATAKNETDRL